MMHQRRAVRLAVIALSLMVATGPARPWGREGQRVVALVAAKNLSPSVRAKLAAILGTNDAGLDAAMAAAATWPDEINKPATGTGNWHFIDVSVTVPFAVGTLCAGHNCVIDQILDMEDRLQNNRPGFVLKKAPSPARPMISQELAFLIHFVGDIHQPLHAATDGDRGGNCVNLASPLHHGDGSRDTTELHAAWDVDEVMAVFVALSDEAATATALYQRFKSGTTVDQLSPLDWARESNDMAKRDVYRALSLPNHSAAANTCALGIADVTLTEQYLTGNRADVELQLMNAGIRLSNVLNQICANSGCKTNPVVAKKQPAQ
jgi:S1/P1 Nuclease